MTTRGHREVVQRKDIKDASQLEPISPRSGRGSRAGSAVSRSWNASGSSCEKKKPGGKKKTGNVNGGDARIHRDLVERVGYWGYFVIFFVVMLECQALLGLFMPGESLVLVSGSLAAQGVLDSRSAHASLFSLLQWWATALAMN